MKNLSIKTLNIETWKDFAQLAQKHNGVWGGCWCTAFHPKSPEKKRSPAATKAYKKTLVEGDRAHAALVFAGDITYRKERLLVVYWMAPLAMFRLFIIPIIQEPYGWGMCNQNGQPLRKKCAIGCIITIYLAIILWSRRFTVLIWAPGHWAI